MNSPIFSQRKAFFKCFRLTSTAAIGYSAKSNCCGIQKSVPKFEKIHPYTDKRGLRKLRPGADMQIAFHQLPVETTGNRYLRKFMPITASICTRGAVYLRPPEIILLEPI